MSVFTNDVTVEGGNVTAVKVDGSAVTQPVSGSVSVSNFPATQPVSGTVAATQGTSPWVISGSVTANSPTSTTSTVTQITSTGVNQVLLAANAARKQVILTFTSGSWNIKFGTGATATSFTYVASAANTVITDSIWTGEIDAICTTSGKLVNVTELS